MEEVRITNARKLSYASLCLALAIVLPAMFGQTQVLGQMFLPMHFAVILCGFICGPSFSAVVGILAPYLRFTLFGIPPIYPMGMSMALELATYGIIVGLLFDKYRYRTFGFVNNKEIDSRKKKIINLVLIVEIVTIIAMIAGRIVWGLCMYLLTLAMGGTFNLEIFMAGAVTGVIPGIICQIVLMPVVVVAFDKAKLI